MEKEEQKLGGKENRKIVCYSLIIKFMLEALSKEKSRMKMGKPHMGRVKGEGNGREKEEQCRDLPEKQMV